MSQQSGQIFLFDMTRNRSHLFFRYLGTHPDIFSMWHPFLQAAVFGPERITQYTNNSDLDGNKIEWTAPSGTDTYADATSNFHNAVQKARDQNKILVANEHTQLTYKQDIALALIRKQSVDIPKTSNPTIIPDHIFADITPVFVIRNPLHAVPSNYISFRQSSQLRIDGEDWRLVNGVPLQRRLFDHFHERNNGTYPIVVDGDDVVWRTDELRATLSRALHLDPRGLSSVWKAVPEEQRSKEPVLRYFLQTIDESTGIIRPSEQRPATNLKLAYEKWVIEYGQEVADGLQATVEENMPHYEYMAQFKI